MHHFLAMNTPNFG